MINLAQELCELGLARSFAEYKPRFSVVEFEPGHWWICDGETRVGLAVEKLGVVELVNHDPAQPRDVQWPSLYHAPTQPGDRITVVKWIDYHQGISGRQKPWVWRVEAGSVTLAQWECWENGRDASTVVRWSVDADFGYVMDVAATMSSVQPEAHEFANFLPRGATTDIPADARYPYILWQHPGGEIRRCNHNNVGATALGAMDMDDRRRIADGGFLAFGGEADHNPALIDVRSTPGATAITCPNMFDEHLFWVSTRVESAPQIGDRYEASAGFRMASLPGPLCERLTAMAQPLDMVTDRVDEVLAKRYRWAADDLNEPGKPKALDYFPMERGKVADFTTRLDPAASFRGQIFSYREDDDKAEISIVSDCAHSGTRSLRIRCNGNRVEVGTGRGNSYHVTEGRRYRFSAYVKSELQGTTRLVVREFLYVPHNMTATHISEAEGTFDWTKLGVEFTPGVQAHSLDLLIEVSGTGQIWADEWLFEEIE